MSVQTLDAPKSASSSLKAQEQIFIIVLNWNGDKDTLECLESLFNLEDSAFQVILVDNASSDGVIDNVRQNYPQVKLIENNENFGFVEGNNVAISYALEQKASYILLLNNDTTVHKDLLKHLRTAIAEHPQNAVLTPKILNYHNPDVIESTGSHLSLWFSKNKAIGYRQKDIGQFDQDRDVSFASGCAFFAKAEVFQNIGLFDKVYFAYYEDMDICYRIQKSGYRLRYVHQAKVWHKVSAASGGYKNPNAIFWSTRNRFLFLWKCGSWAQKLFFCAYFFAFYAPFFLMLNFVQNRKEQIRAFLKGVFSLFSAKVKYHQDFPYKVLVDCSPISKSKAGVGYYTAGLTNSLQNTHTHTNFRFFRYRFTESFDLKILNITLRLFWEQVFLPLHFLWQRADLVHFPAFVSPLIKTSKTVITIHDMAYMLFPELFVPIYRTYLRFFVPLSVKNADLIIAMSENTKQDIIKLLGHKVNNLDQKIKVLYQGINPAYEKIENAQEVQNKLKKFNLPEQYILTVGTLEPRKNIKGLIFGFDQFLKNNPDSSAHLVIAGGKGWFYDEVFACVSELERTDRISFTGYVSEEDLLYLYNGASVFIYPSFYEGFGLPPLEAMACGLPVITSNTSSLPEVVGDDAILIDPHNCSDIAQGIERILRDPQLREQLSLRGLERVKQFSWENAGKRTLEAYSELLKASHRAR